MFTGVFAISRFRDLTVDGSITLAGPLLAAAFARRKDGITRQRRRSRRSWPAWLGRSRHWDVLAYSSFHINGLLAGILVMTALYSVNLRVMGKSNVPLDSNGTRPDNFHGACRISARPNRP